MSKSKEDRLTQEALAATNAGMSYGKWKAQQASPHSVLPKSTGSAAQSRPLCRICGKVIPEFSRRRIYCSKECAEKVVYQR